MAQNFTSTSAEISCPLQRVFSSRAAYSYIEADSNPYGVKAQPCAPDNLLSLGQVWTLLQILRFVAIRYHSKYRVRRPVLSEPKLWCDLVLSWSTRSSHRGEKRMEGVRLSINYWSWSEMSPKCWVRKRWLRRKGGSAAGHRWGE